MAQTAEEKREYKRKWREKNREKIREYDHSYYQENTEAYLASNARSVARHRDRVNRSSAAWAAANREKVYAAGSRRRAKKAGNGGSHTAEQWYELMLACGWCCLACGAETEIQKDHIVPIAVGGTDNIDNLQPLCKACNLRKLVTTVDYRPEAVRLWVAGGAQL